jgi:DNA-binding LytR/AlgR family response regulator
MRNVNSIPSQKNPYHPDIVLFLILIPFISAVNYYLTYSNIQLSWFLVLTFTIDTVQGYIAWWACRYFILFLDRRWTYGNGGLARLAVQLIATLIIGLGIISVLTELVSWIAKGKGAPLSFYTVDLFIIGIWFFVINGIYIGLYYYNLWKQTDKQREEDNRIKTDGLLIKNGKQEIRLSFDEVVGFSLDGEYVIANHISGKKYFVDQSLDKVEKTIPDLFFFRLNRQFILHRQIITGFRKEDNGKIIVLSNKSDSFPTEITVSRIKAPAFKDWFRPNQ